MYGLDVSESHHIKQSMTHFEGDLSRFGINLNVMRLGKSYKNVIFCVMFNVKFGENSIAYN